MNEEKAEKEEKRTLSGLDKAAILYKALGPNLAQPLFDKLSDKEIAKIQAHVNSLEYVSFQETKEVLEDFYFNLMSRKVMAPKGRQLNPFSFLYDLNDMQILNLLRNETARIHALALAQLPGDRSARLIGRLNADLQNEVIVELGKLQDIPMDAIDEVASNLAEKALALPRFKEVSIGGTQTLGQILDNLDPRAAHSLMESIKRQDPDMATEVRKVHFVFEDLAVLPDDMLKEILRGFEPPDLALALKGTPEEFRKRILDSLAERPRLLVNDEYEILGAVPRRRVENAQQNIIKKLKEMEKEGEFRLSDFIGAELVE